MTSPSFMGPLSPSMMSTASFRSTGTRPTAGVDLQQHSLRYLPVKEPTIDDPWSVDVTSAIPFAVMEEINGGKYVTGCSTGRWFCAVVQKDDSHKILIWYTPPNQKLPDLKFKTPYHVLDHDGSMDGSSVPLIAMTEANNPTNNSLDDFAVYVYAANAESGHLALWRVSRTDLIQSSSTSKQQQQQQQQRVSKSHPRSCVGFVFGHDTDENSDDGAEDLPRLTSLEVAWSSAGTKGSPCIILGSSHGHVYWVTQTHVPPSLHVKDVSIAAALHSGGNESGGLLSRLFKTPTKARRRAMEDDPENHVVKLHVLRNGLEDVDENYYFVSTCITGKVILWKVIMTESSQNSLLQIHSTTDLTNDRIIDYYQNYQTIDRSTIPPEASLITILSSALQTTSSNGLMLSFVVSTEQYELEPDDSRMYWIQMLFDKQMFQIRYISWINRFTNPLKTVRIIGLAIADNHVCYAAMRPVEGRKNSAHCTVVMALPFPADIDMKDGKSMALLEQVELPSEQSLLVNIWVPDLVTHGISTLDQTGLGLRIRWVHNLLPSDDDKVFRTYTDPRGVRQHFVVNSTSGVRNSQNRINVLANHLHAAHRESYTHPDHVVRLPPAVTTATGTAELEEAILTYARKSMILASSNVSYYSVPPEDEDVIIQSMQVPKQPLDSMSNPVESHLTLIAMLQQTGVYRSLSDLCKWKLLSIGQEVMVYRALSNDSLDNLTEWQQRQLHDLNCNEVAEWLNQVQTTVVLQDGSGEDRQAIWLHWLYLALETAMTFREERALSCYDVLPNAPAKVNSTNDVPVWTSNELMQDVFSNQLKYWQRSENHRSSAKMEDIETIVQYALQSFGDLFISCPGSQDARDMYAQIQKKSFEILRDVKGLQGDMLLFELCLAHNFFDGLCQIAFDHDRRSDRQEFSLIPLFTAKAGMTDVGTQLPFPRYVLQWHTQRLLFGHVLNYGKECPEILDEMIQSIEVLRPFRWIHATRKGDFNSAADSLLNNAQQADAKLGNARLAVTMASLSNSIVEHESSTPGLWAESVVKRKRLIDKKRELINAQQELLGDDNSILLSAAELLDHAVDKFRLTEHKESKVQAAIIALAVCTTFEAYDDMKDGAVFVWYEAIVADIDDWEDWLRRENDLTDSRLRDVILQQTVFGGLVQQSEDMDGWEEVRYGAIVEDEVFDKLAHLQPHLLADKMQRLLRSVTSEDHELSAGVSGESMILA